ncbi:ABC-type Fe3+-hydroxamate transport system, periplasmic component [Clostridium aceticum]|uniref:ABC-type Fe3+-hydroxamate transport system, periplasmic component n=1 Tax=Clostridium aceticum TaxID=84022 RepID=A0A0D8IGH7_9CLOT|nr:cobalamin-binding protein [Clostridium aceticum]AKL94466.1 ABC-type Fe3+-hydroxamate transport system, periplasmic component [Clostridium aceticum]KJF28316.1 ABC transporter substrate-binding protein [Clostridium aceticum]
MNKKAKLLIMGLLIISVVLAGCASPANTEENLEAGATIEVTDGLGNIVSLNEEPKRIISAVPSHTEILFALGLEEHIIAVSEYCDYPVEALDKEKIGGYKNLNIERIIELEPDILFIYGEGDEEVVQQILASGITVARYEPETIEEIFETIISMGEVTGREETAEAIVGELTAKKDNILEKIKDQEVVGVFYEIWDEPLMTAGSGSFMDELINLAKGENIAADGEGAYPIFSIEALVERNPQVYLLPASHVMAFDEMTEKDIQERIDEIKSRPGFGEISAIQHNRVGLLEPNIVSRPGIRIIEALEAVARAIHPNVF